MITEIIFKMKSQVYQKKAYLSDKSGTLKNIKNYHIKNG